MKQNEEIEQKKVEDQRRLKSNKQAAASSSLAASQMDNLKRSSAVISKLEEDDESRELASQLAVGENSMDVKILKLAAELLDEINQFIENLWLAQREPASSEGAQNDTRSGNAQKQAA